MALIRSPWARQFDSLVDRAQSDLLISSPYISSGACDRLVAGIDRRGRSSTLRVTIVTDLSLDNLVRRVTDIAALIRVSNAVPHTQVRFIPTLHAKAYVADVQEAIVTSANMTDAGLFRNLEYGVYFDDPTLVRQIRHDIEGYGHLGPRVPLATLDQLAEAAGKVEVEQRVVNDSAAKAARAALRRLLTNADDLVLAARTAGRSLTAILEDTVLYLLKKSPLPTTEIHARVQQIHPDLCDDSVHRMIAGRSYGKRWKHSVRTAQSHLKERGFAVLRDGLWTLAPGWQSDRAVPIIPPDE